MSQIIDFGTIAASLPAMLWGLMTTTVLAFAVAVIGLMLAIPMALARMSAHRYLSWPAWAFVVFFRGAPLLLVLYLVYYGLGQVAALHSGPAWLILGSPIACAVIGLTLNHVAYLVDIVRGSLNAIPAGLVEAAAALGISSRDALIRIRLPLALRYGLEAYQNEIVGFTKGTAVVSVITVVDLTAVANEVFQRTYDPISPMLTAALFYWILVTLIRMGFGRLRISLERHIPIATGVPR